jgi:hypothetical protein
VAATKETAAEQTNIYIAAEYFAASAAPCWKLGNIHGTIPNCPTDREPCSQPKVVATDNHFSSDE